MNISKLNHSSFITSNRYNSKQLHSYFNMNEIIWMHLKTSTVTFNNIWRIWLWKLFNHVEHKTCFICVIWDILLSVLQILHFSLRLIYLRNTAVKHWINFFKVNKDYQFAVLSLTDSSNICAYVSSSFSLLFNFKNLFHVKQFNDFLLISLWFLISVTENSKTE